MNTGSRQSLPNKKRILFVCSPDSTHAASWMSLLHGFNLDVRVFAVYLQPESRYLPAWEYPTYSLFYPPTERLILEVVQNLIPKNLPLKKVQQKTADRYRLREWYLDHVIKKFKPEIIHAFPLNTGGKPLARVLKKIPEKKWPKIVVSTWGSDLRLGKEKKDEEGENTRFLLKNSNGLFSDCETDLKVAISYTSEKLQFAQSMPGTGGLDLEQFTCGQTDVTCRKIILIPKAFERGHANRTVPILEALCGLEPELASYEVHLLMCSGQVKEYLKSLPKWVQNKCITHGMIPQTELIKLMKKSRLMLAPSLSDGTPNVMLEAMACGALPIMHPLDSIKEWIDDGENGLLAHALYPDKILGAIKRGLEDDQLCRKALKINGRMSAQRTDGKKNKIKIRQQYERLL